MHMLRFGNKLNEEVCHGFVFANLFNSLYLKVRLWWNILVANLATNFQGLVAKVKNLVTLVPVLGAISRPEILWTNIIGVVRLTVRRITNFIWELKGKHSMETR